MYRKAKMLLFSGAILTVAVLVLRNAKSHAPVQYGTAPEFWKVACDIDVDGSMKDFDKMGWIYPPQGEWAIYYISGYHDEFLHRVPVRELAPYLPKIETELKNKATEGETWPLLSRVSADWTREGNDEEEVRRLLALMRDTHLAIVKEKDRELHQYVLEKEKLFQERWHRANRYWITVVFEVVWLSGVLGFTLWPLLRDSSRMSWAIHLGLAAPLLFLPFFLGYVPYTFTSAFPAGGIYYPYVLYWFRGLPVFDVDIWYYEHAPQPFEPLTQEPGPMLAITGMGLVGPVAICAIGLAIFIGVLGFATLWKKLIARIRRKAKSGQALIPLDKSSPPSP